MEGGGEANDGGAAITTGMEVDGSDDAIITVFILCTNNEMKFAIQVSVESSVESFKSEIAKHCDIPAERQRLIYEGQLLENDRTLKDYGLEAVHTVHLVPDLLPAGSNNTTVEHGIFGAVTLDLSEFMESADIQQGLINIPRMSTEWMNQLLNDPDTLRNMVMNSPELREAINRDPHLARIYNDPNSSRLMAESAVLREIIERARGDGGSTSGGGGATPMHAAGTDRSVPPVGLGGLGIPDLERMLGSTIDPISVNQLAQNPAIPQMIQRNLSDPQNMNPVLNPQYWEIMRNRSLTRESIPNLTSPETMEQMMALNQSLSYLLGEQPITREVGETSGGTVGPEEVYASQLAQLLDMGFSDVCANLEALVATAGNVEGAAARLAGK